MFEITQFPDNVPTPEPKTTAFMLGGVLHLLNLIVRIYQSSDVPGSDRDWEDMYREQKGRSWFTWVSKIPKILYPVLKKGPIPDITSDSFPHWCCCIECSLPLHTRSCLPNAHEARPVVFS